MPSITNFDRFAALLSPQQLTALGCIKVALQDDPTCLDTHVAGFAQEMPAPSKEVLDGQR